MSEQPAASLVDRSAPTSESVPTPPSAKDKQKLVLVLVVLVVLIIGGAWLSATSEWVALGSCLGVPILLTLCGWFALADGLRQEDTAMFKDDMAGALYSIPMIPSAITVSAFIGIIVSRLFRGDVVFTALLGQFFAAFCVVTVVGCCLVGCREYLLCWRHRDS